MAKPAFASPSVVTCNSKRVSCFSSVSQQGRLPLCTRNVRTRAPASIKRHVSPTATSRPSDWVKVAIGVAGLAAGTLFPNVSASRRHGFDIAPSPVCASEKLAVRVIEADPAIPLNALGIRQEEFVSHRELARRKTTQYSEAEEEIMELEEDEVESQWFYDLQRMWAGLASVGGILVLYKGGVLWEKWIQEQERKDIEEEIELTGTFIDPRAVRKEEEDEKKNKKKKGDDPDAPVKPSSPSGSSGPDSGSPPTTDDVPPGGIESLERLFGKS